MPAYRFQMGDRPLEGYTIQHALGRGGFGEVYFAISDAGREVALKAIQNHEEIELRGLSHCMNLKSPHLVMIFDVKQDADGMAWVIMEYVSGASLREILDEAADGLGEEQATYFIRELCRGLSYLHDAGIVHRDLKPHNIFFEDGVVKIGDYSLSKAITTSHRSGHTTTVGSVHYMAPEIGEGRYDKTIDIYALGVILFEMMTGSPPYEGESMGEVLMKHLSQEPDVGGLPQPFARVVAKSMRRDPNNRYQTASEMLRDLAASEELEHSRPPASLSMIGQRAAQDRASRIRSPTSLAETFATPVALRDTYENHDSMPFERPGMSDLNSLGLWWRPSTTAGLSKDNVSISIRCLMAAFVCLSLVALGGMDNAAFTLWGDVVPLALVHATYSSLCCWFFLSTMPRTSGFASALVTRGIAIVPLLLLLVLTACMQPSGEFDEFIPTISGLMAAHALMDYRSLLSADRYPRVSVFKTLLAGSIAMAVAALMQTEYLRFTGSIAFSSAIVIQLLAPHGQRQLSRSKHITNVDTESSIGSLPVTTEPSTHQEIQC